MSKKLSNVSKTGWIVVAALLFFGIGLLALLIYQISWEVQRNRFEEDRAVMYARSLAWVWKERDPSEAYRFIKRMELSDPTVVEFAVIVGGDLDRRGMTTQKSYGLHLNPGYIDHTLNTIKGKRHKTVSDLADKVRSEADIKINGGKALSDLKQEDRAVPYFQIVKTEEEGIDYRTVAVPIVHEDEFLGTVLVTLLPDSDPPASPAIMIFSLILLALGVFISILLTSTGVLDPKKLKAACAAMIVLVALGSVIAFYYSMTKQVESACTQRVDELLALTEASGAIGTLEEEPFLNFVAVDFTDSAVLILDELSIDSGESEPAISATFMGNLIHGRVFAVAGILLIVTIVLILLLPMFMLFAAYFRRSVWAYLYVTPAMIGMLLLVYTPFVFGIVLSFFDNDFKRYYFTGIDNFYEVLIPGASTNIHFYRTLGVTFLWTGSNVFLHVTIGLTLALLLNNPKLKFKGIYRMLLIIPWAIPNYITALIWKGMFNREFGIFNLLLGKFGVEPIDWLAGSFASAFSANLATNTWLGFPFMMVVSLGALQSIPGDLYEAAQVDGASKWQQFKLITLPLLKPALYPAIILGTIWTFNMFNIIYLVSGGGPNHQTEILITEAYWAFRTLQKYGLAAAYSTVIFLILLMYTLVTNRMTKATENVAR